MDATGGRSGDLKDAFSTPTGRGWARKFFPL